MAAYGARLLAAYRGRPMDLTPALAAVENELIDGADGYAVEVASYTTAVLNNGLGRYPDAVAAAREVAYEPVFVAPFALSELIEAAVRSGDPAAAKGALERLSVHTVDGSDWAMGIEARSRALLSAGAEAEGHYVEAVRRFGRTRLRPDLARAHLIYGEWLRGAHRRVDARHHLRTAYDLLTGIGADAFAERARHELLAAGERIRKREVDNHTGLTAQEEHIARLARDGRTNPEIGAELFISARTVEWHLRKVFTKLGITSRKGLHDALRSSRQDAPS
jgi:ATP/maltotriose-dependent transcriptional regulator MalT